MMIESFLKSVNGFKRSATQSSGRLISVYRFACWFAIAIVTFTATLSVQGTVVKHAVPYISQLEFSHWGQSACGPTSATMCLRYYYPNSGIDVAEVYAAGTQQNTYFGPLIGRRNVGWQTTNVWQGTTPDSGNSRVPVEFRGYFGGGQNSGMVADNLVNYLNNTWGGMAAVRSGQTMVSLIAEVKQRPVMVNVQEIPGFAHYIVLVGHNDKGTSSTSDDTFFINDPYHPYQGGAKGTVEVTYAKLQGWFNPTKRFITFTPDPVQSAGARKYSVLVDNGIDNYPDTGRLNKSCSSGANCFYVGNRDERNGSGYFWQRKQTGGKDWLYPTKSGSYAAFRPYLSKAGPYDMYVRFYGDSTQGNVKYEIRDRNTTVRASKTINQKVSGFQSVYLGRFDLSNGWFVQATNIPANCNVDAVFFRYAGLLN